MKANELMVGNWVTGKKWRENPFKLTRINDNGKYYYGIASDETQVGPFLLEEIEPVPLTPDILEKNGWRHEFDKTDYMVKYDLRNKGKNCWMMWSIKEHNLDVQRQDEKLDMYNLKASRVVIPCDYVHDLQHALRLCGIEKTIEL